MNTLLEVSRIRVQEGIEVNAASFVDPKSGERETRLAAVGVLRLASLHEAVLLAVEGLKRSAFNTRRGAWGLHRSADSSATLSAMT